LKNLFDKKYIFPLLTHLKNIDNLRPCLRKTQISRDGTLKNLSIKRLAIGAAFGAAAALYLFTPSAETEENNNHNDQADSNLLEQMDYPHYPDDQIISEDYLFSILEITQQEHVIDTNILAETLNDKHNKRGVFEDGVVTVKELKDTVASLDPHSAYLTPKELFNLMAMSTGEYAGVGIYVGKKEEGSYIEIINPIKGSPADKAGLEAGEVITKINGTDTRSLNVNEAVELMLGEIDTDVSLSIEKSDGSTYEVELTRKTISLPSVQHKVIGDDIGYIQITGFQSNTTHDLRKAVRELRRDLGRDVKGYVIDLRNNLGGLLGQAIDVSNTFITEGKIVEIGDAKGNIEESINAQAYDLTRGKPIIVLTNGNSASASEIVAGAMQDNNRAIILGTQTFGKGSVQAIIPLNDGSGIKVTTQLYYTPSGDTIQGKGITPDILFDNGNDNGSSKDHGEATFKGTIENPNLANDNTKTVGVCSENENNTGPYELPLLDDAGDETKLDAQLACAVDLLRDEKKYTSTSPINIAPNLTQ
jgi:carboxyl-terminal processing protease